MSVTVGDFNADGQQDLATANVDGQHRVHPAGPGRWHLPSPPKTSGWEGPLRQSPWATSMAMASRIWPPLMCRADTVSILLGQRRWHLPTRSRLWGGSGLLVSVTVGDFNGDGQQDLATANRGAGTVSILLGQGDGTFERRSRLRGGSRSWSVTVGDFNGDSQQDLATANSESTACPSCWGGAMAPSSPLKTLRWDWFLYQSPWATSMAMAARIWPSPSALADTVVHPAGPRRWHLPGAQDVAVG